MERQLRRAGLQPVWAEVPLSEPRPRSWSAQQRAIQNAVIKALAAERAALAAATASQKPAQPAR